jgi:hypothetical protein
VVTRGSRRLLVFHRSQTSSLTPMSTFKGRATSRQNSSSSMDAGNNSDVSYVEFDSNQQPTTGPNPITSPFAYLRNRKRSNELKAQRSLESVGGTKSPPLDSKSLPPVPPLPNQYSHQYSNSEGNGGLNQSYYCMVHALLLCAVLKHG